MKAQSLKINTLIFDIDGTLVHLPWNYAERVTKEALSMIGAKKASQNEIKQFWYGHSRDAFIEQTFKVNKNDFWTAFNIADKERAKNMQLYDDSMVFKDLRNEGFKIGFMTGTKHSAIPDYLKKLGLKVEEEILVNDYLHKVPSKPHPAGLRLCMKKLESKPSETAYIGNADEDILAAKSAKVLDIIVDRKEYALTKKPTFKIQSLFELKEVLKTH